MKSEITKLKPLNVRKELINRQIRFFRPFELGRIFGVKDDQIKYFVEKYTREGLFFRLKKGLYGLKEELFPLEEIASVLYRPSYISFESALSHYQMIPETVYAVTSATSKPTREFSVEEWIFSYHTIKKEAYTGYLPAEKDGRTYYIAEPEKALADYLYYVSLGKKKLNDRLDISGIDKKKVRLYADLFERKKMILILEKLNI